jgi:general secretion pathway protein E
MSYRLPWMFFLLFLFTAAATIASGQENSLPASDADWSSITSVHPDTFRGPGFYFNIYKLLACLTLFFCWIHTADWVNQDLQFHRLRIHTWNPIVVGSFSVALLLMWIIPWQHYFWIGLLLLLVAYLGPVLIYIFAYRNPAVDEHEKVLTPIQLRFWLSGKLAYVGIHIDAEDPAAEAEIKEHTVSLLPVGLTSSQDNQAITLTARQLAGYSAAVDLFGDAFERRASALLLNFGEQTGVRYMIDDIWHNLPPRSLETGKQITEVLACLAFGEGGSAENQTVEKKKEAEFIFKIRSYRESVGTIPLNVTGQRDKFDGQWEEVFPCMLSRSVQEHSDRWLIRLHREIMPFHALPDLGMREKTAAAITDTLEKSDGMLLFSALPGGGLTTTLNVALEGVDRYMRDFVSIEDTSQREAEIVNVDRRTYNSAAGESPADIIPSVSRASPDVIVCRNLVDAKSAKILCDLAESQHLIITTIPARDSVEALLRVLVMEVPAASFASAISTVVHGRLIRKLCEDCREPYAPSAELLKKMGIPEGRIEYFYRSPDNRETTVCEFCDGIGYRGRIGIYELLIINDEMRSILVSGQPPIESLRKAARAAGFQTELDHGKLLVARGVTSVDELQRAFKT